MVGFLRSEQGSVTVDWVVITASVIGLTLAAIGILSGTTERQSNAIVLTMEERAELAARFDLSPYDLAQRVDRTHYGPNWVTNRMNRLLNELSEQQLRNQFATWTDRAADPAHEHHAKAADQLAMLEIAMEARGVEP